MTQVGLGEYREEAASLVASGQYTAARRLAEHILHHYPDYVAGHQLLGRALLGTGCHLDAAKQFSWVLSCDPESVEARLGLARVHQALGNVDIARAHLQRAFDLFPGDADLRRELNELLDADAGGAADPREMTRAALARIYARNGLIGKAVQEFEAVLQHEPERNDVLLALAETFWQEGRQAEAVTLCHRVLDNLPKALKANLIVGAAWLVSPQPDEAQPYLTVVRALDPEHILAEAVLGAEPPFPADTPMIERLAVVPGLRKGAETPLPVGEPRVSAAEGWAEAATPRELDSHGEETTPMSDQSRPEEEFEIPDWLQGVGDELLADDHAPTPPPGTSSAADETPDWLRALVSRVDETAPEGVGAAQGTDTTRGAAPEAAADRPPVEHDAGGLPDWLQRIASGEGVVASTPAATSPEPAETDAEMAEWLNQLTAMRSEAAAAVDESLPGGAVSLAPPAADVEIEPSDLPDWLREAPAVSATPPLPHAAAGPVEDLPDWLRDEEAAEPAAPSTAGSAPLPDWLQAVAAGAPLSEAHAAPAVPMPEAATPGSPEPSPVDELPDWLKAVAAGAPTTDSTAVPTATPPQPPEQVPAEELSDWLREEKPEPVAPAADELPEWLRAVAQGEPEPKAEIPSGVTREETGAAPAEPELPAWLTEDTVPAEAAAATQSAPGAERAEAESIMPEWLRELNEPRTQPATGPMAVTADQDAGIPEPEGADLPEWLRRLRSGVTDEAPPLGTRELEADLAALSIVQPAGVSEEVPPWEAPVPPPAAAEAVLEPPPIAVPESPPAEEPSATAEEVEEPVFVVEPVGTAPLEPDQQPVPVMPAEELPTVVAAAEAEPVSAPIEDRPAPLPEVVPRSVGGVEETTIAPPPAIEVVVPAIADLPKDSAERLALARAAAMSASWPQALTVYESLVGSADLLNAVISDLEEGIRKHPDDYAGYQLVGDAYMKDGRLPEALRAYRAALTKLQR